MSFAPQVRTGRDPEFYGNALRFATREEAEANVAELMSRWFLVVETRVVESPDPVTHAWVNGRLVDANWRSIDTAVRNLCVDGHEFADPDSAWAGDGQYPPFAIFDIDAQENLQPYYATRAEAEAAMARILAGSQ